ncbi:MAG: hypothetical protein H7144_06945 [Burkholderiales bacterium]|nr:hypothetical protein [Phycisphaerae bacterium]
MQSTLCEQAHDEIGAQWRDRLNDARERLRRWEIARTDQSIRHDSATNNPQLGHLVGDVAVRIEKLDETIATAADVMQTQAREVTLAAVDRRIADLFDDLAKLDNAAA